MNLDYLKKLTPYPKEKNVVLAKPGYNTTLKPNYFHFNKNDFRMGEDFLTLGNSKEWYQFHVTEAKIIYPSVETHVGITEDELKKLENNEGVESVIIEVDLLRSNQHTKTPSEIFLPSGNQIEVNGDLYNMKTDYNSGNFHMSTPPFGVIGERFNVEIFL